MRLILKVFTIPFVVMTGILYLFCEFFLIASGTVLGILSGIISIVALALLFVVGFWPGMSWLIIAFLLSPYGIPMVAAWLVGIIGSINRALRNFILR